jgi:hypothetical protein
MGRTFPRTGSLTAVAALALVLLAGSAPRALASKQHTYTATIDCGEGPVVVDSTDDMFAPLVDRATGRKYRPVKWQVKVGKKTIRATKPGWHGGPTVRCSYDDGQAVGTVTVQRPHGHAKHHSPAGDRRS